VRSHRREPGSGGRAVTHDEALRLAAQVVRDEKKATDLAADESFAVLSILASAQAVVTAQIQAQALLSSATPNQVARDAFANRLTVTSEEVAKWTGVPKTHITKLCRSGAITATKPGKEWLIQPRAVTEWLAREDHRPEKARLDGRLPTPLSSERPTARLGALPKNSRTA